MYIIIIVNSSGIRYVEGKPQTTSIKAAQLSHCHLHKKQPLRWFNIQHCHTHTEKIYKNSFSVQQQWTGNISTTPQSTPTLWTLTAASKGHLTTVLPPTAAFLPLCQIIRYLQDAARYSTEHKATNVVLQSRTQTSWRFCFKGFLAAVFVNEWVITPFWSGSMCCSSCSVCKVQLWVWASFSILL